MENFDNLKLNKIFNTHYINIVKNSLGIPPSTTTSPNNPLEDSNTVKNMIENYKNHPSTVAEMLQKPNFLSYAL